VGDRADDLRRALHFAASQSSLILVTGGLGPTADDITRPVLSEFSGIPLEEDRDVITHLEERFSAEPGQLRENIRRQGRIPVGGTYLPNPNGTAVGLVFERDTQLLVALPGPPRELQPMLTDRLVPLLIRRFGTRPTGSSLQMRFVGIGESSIDKTIRDHLVLPENLEVSSLFEAGRVDLTFSLPENGPEAMAQLRTLQKILEEQIGQYLYSDNGLSLEECVLAMMVERDITLGLAEVGTGGAISASLSDLANSQQVMKGGLTAISDFRLDSMIPAKAHNSLATNQDRILVSRLCLQLGSSLGLIVTEPSVSEDGTRSVEVIIGNSEFCIKSRLPMRGHGENTRRWLVSDALDLLRRELEKM